MTDAEMIRAFKIIRALTAEEGSSVQIFADNPEFGGLNSLIITRMILPIVKSRGFGDVSVLACLEAAAKNAGVAVE